MIEPRTGPAFSTVSKEGVGGQRHAFTRVIRLCSHGTAAPIRPCHPCAWPTCHSQLIRRSAPLDCRHWSPALTTLPSWRDLFCRAPAYDLPAVPTHSSETKPRPKSTMHHSLPLLPLRICPLPAPAPPPHRPPKELLETMNHIQSGDVSASHRCRAVSA